MFSLLQPGRRMLNVIVIAMSLWLLLPTTILFVLGLFASMAGIYQHQQFNGSFVYFTALLLLPGVGLSAIWWLTFAFPFLKGVRSIPRIVWAGLLIGFAFTLLFFISSHSRLVSETSSVVGAKNTLTGTLNLGGGPLAASVLLVAGIWLRQRYF